jgi:hypothetical protein
MCARRPPLAPHPARVEQQPDVWHTPPRKEGHSMTDRLKEHWSGVLLTACMVGLLLGSVLVLRLTGN